MPDLLVAKTVGAAVERAFVLTIAYFYGIVKFSCLACKQQVTPAFGASFEHGLIFVVVPCKALIAKHLNF